MLGRRAIPIRVSDYRALARRRLPRMVFDYLDGGAEDEKGLRHNRDVFDRFRFVPRRLVDVSQRSTATTLFDKSLPAPLVISSTGLNAIFWPRGDIELARAAERFGIPFALSTPSNASLEEVAESTAGDKWFQLYVIHRDLADQLADRALAANYTTLMLTVDVTVNGYRERDIRNGFGIPVRYTPGVLLDGALHPRWSLDLLRHGMPQLANLAGAGAKNVEIQAALLSRNMDTSFDWEDLARLRDRWPRRLVVKGLAAPSDVRRCAELGVDAVVLSNHGGRQLDSAVSAMDVLEQAVAVAGVMPILVDGGFRRGSDVVKALALGARVVLLGRAVLYGLAARGGPGVQDVLRMFAEEIDRTLAQIGCRSIAELDRSFVADMNQWEERA